MRLAKIGTLTIAAAFWTTVVVADQGHGHAPAPTRVTTSGAPRTQSTSTHSTSHGPATKPTTTTTKSPTTTTSTSHGPSTHGSSHKSTTTTTTSSTAGSTARTTRTTSHEVEHDGASHATTHHETEHHEAEHTTSTHGKSPRPTTTGGTTTGGTTTGGTTTGGTTTGGTTTGGTTTGGTTTTTSPIATKIKSHPQLAATVTAMLPAGMTMDQAASGFRNQGQFLAALNASRRLNIPFADLKTAMVTNHQSLGQAIQQLRPGVDADAEAAKGEAQAAAETK